MYIVFLIEFFYDKKVVFLLTLFFFFFSILPNTEKYKKYYLRFQWKMDSENLPIFVFYMTKTVFK